MSDSFADEPVTITALRAAKSENAKLWTPRDALIDVLRRIDKGEIKPNALTVVWREEFDTGGGIIDFSTSAESDVVTLVLLQRAAYRININMDPD